MVGGEGVRGAVGGRHGGGGGSADEETQLIKNMLLQNICTALDLTDLPCAIY